MHKAAQGGEAACMLQHQACTTAVLGSAAALGLLVLLGRTECRQQQQQQQRRYICSSKFFFKTLDSYPCNELHAFIVSM